MKLLHTSDWHLGRPLYGRSRHREFEAFLSWAGDLIESEQVDILVVSGDIFDTTTPSNRAQELYYRFLHRASRTVRHAVVIGGNHDSPTLLDAPRALLREFNVHVLGAAASGPEDELLVLRDAQGEPEALVCAVPYLRDRDIRTVEPGESPEDKNRKLLDGIERHYLEVCAIADTTRSALSRDIPLIATGHLFTAGGATVDGDGVREIYVGSLARVARSAFPASIDYLALGHLHVAQMVGGEGRLRYSGSPLPMGFGEAAQRKVVLLVHFEGRSPAVTEVPVPCFQRLERLAGSLGELSARIMELRAAGSDAWLEIEYRGDEPAALVQESLDAAVSGSLIEILRIRSVRSSPPSLSRADASESLEELDPDAVFDRCLDAHDVDDAIRPDLLDSFRELLRSIHEEDSMGGEGGAG